MAWLENQKPATNSASLNRWTFAPPMSSRPGAHRLLKKSSSPTPATMTGDPAEFHAGVDAVARRLCLTSVNEMFPEPRSSSACGMQPRATDRSGMMTMTKAMDAGWYPQTPSNYATEFGKVSPTFGKRTPFESLAPAELKHFVVSQLNNMYAYMEQAMARERTRASSDVSLMLRKVDRDLRDAFRAVRETFISLTEQVQCLVEEVEVGRKTMKEVQTKFDAANRSAQLKAQYVTELEAVLDGQVPNVSEKMRKICEEMTAAKLEVEKLNKKADEQELERVTEKRKLEETIRTLEDRLNQSHTVQNEMKGAVEVPIMKEMAATWTLRSESRTSGLGGSLVDSPAPQHVDIVDSTLAQCDATRAVTRAKCVRPPHARSPCSSMASKRRLPRAPASRRREESEAVVHHERRAQVAEQRLAEQHKLILQAVPSLQLLRDVFYVLHQHWRLSPSPLEASDELAFSDKDFGHGSKAPEVLDRIVHLFVCSFQNLGRFSDILDSLCEEAKKPPPQDCRGLNIVPESGASFNDAPPSRDHASIGTHSAIPSPPRSCRVSFPAGEEDEVEGETEIDEFPHRGSLAEFDPEPKLVADHTIKPDGLRPPITKRRTGTFWGL